MLRTNRDKLVEIAVQGGVMPPRGYGWEISHDGRPWAGLPGMGGITYNVRLGDSVYGWESDHVEPGASCTASDKIEENPNKGFTQYACVGNEVRVLGGDAKGAVGVITGQHGGVEHVIVDFADEALEKLTFDDKMMIRCRGAGLKLLDHPEIAVYSLSPELLDKIPMRDLGAGRLEVPVTATVPAVLMGSGLGHQDSFKSDYDIQTSDREAIRELGLEGLRFGDLVAVIDHDATWGWRYKRGGVLYAVVVHGDSFLPGHGPGIQVLMTCGTNQLVPRKDPGANIGRYLGLGRFRKGAKAAKAARKAKKR